MAFRFEAATPTHPWCTLHLAGLVTADDLRVMIRTQIDQGAWAGQALIDTTAVTGMRQGYNDLVEQVLFVERVSAGLPSRGAVAILAPADDVFGVARMYQVAQDATLGFRLEVFRTREGAEAFLRQVGAP
ncbi:MAG: hypothetical protein ABL982_14335 [Vicinamibacterales bacterium]